MAAVPPERNRSWAADLPEEVLARIFFDTTSRHLYCNIAFVCKKWQQVAAHGMQGLLILPSTRKHFTHFCTWLPFHCNSLRELAVDLHPTDVGEVDEWEAAMDVFCLALVAMARCQSGLPSQLPASHALRQLNISVPGASRGPVLDASLQQLKGLEELIICSEQPDWVPHLHGLQRLTLLRFHCHAPSLTTKGLRLPAQLRKLDLTGVGAINGGDLAYLTQLTGLTLGADELANLGPLLHHYPQALDVRLIMVRQNACTRRAMDDARVHHLLQQVGPERLVELSLTGCTPSPALAALTRLASLDVSLSPSASTGLAPLLPRLTSLRMLSLMLVGEGEEAEEETISDEALRFISCLTPLKQLRDLDCTAFPFAERGSQYVTELSKLTQLTRLGLTEGGCSDAVLSVLATHMPCLKELDLECNPNITDAVLPVLASFTRLRGLSLLDTDVTSDGLTHLTRLPALEGLIAGGESSVLSPAFFEAIAKLTQLSSLYLTGSAHELDPADAAAPVRKLTNLLSLSLAGVDGVSPDLLEELEGAIPGCLVGRPKAG